VIELSQDQGFLNTGLERGLLLQRIALYKQVFGADLQLK
jgi:hypothetical protein